MEDYFQKVRSYVGKSRTTVREDPVTIGESTEPTRPSSPVRPIRPTLPAPTPTAQTQKKRGLTTSPESTDEGGYQLVSHKKRTRIQTPDHQEASVTERDLQSILVDSDCESEGTGNRYNEQVSGKQRGENLFSASEEKGGRPKTKRDSDHDLPSNKTTQNDEILSALHAFRSSGQPSRMTHSMRVAGVLTTSQPTATTGPANAGSTTSQTGSIHSKGISNNREVTATASSSDYKISSFILKPKSSTKILILGDSNLRYAKSDNSKYEIHSFPGAYLLHINKMLSVAELNDSLTDIVIAVGINHRDQIYRTHTQPELRKLVSIASKMTQRVHFLGVSTPTEPTNNIRDLNDEARTGFGARYIPPLPPNHVKISKFDTIYNIHHDVSTIERVMDSIHRHLGQSGSLNET
jgi:hypothetical protein